MAKFCPRCGQKVTEGALNFFSATKSHEFEDGTYCETCAKIKVEEARK